MKITCVQKNNHARTYTIFGTSALQIAAQIGDDAGTRGWYDISGFAFGAFAVAKIAQLAKDPATAANWTALPTDVARLEVTQGR